MSVMNLQKGVEGSKNKEKQKRVSWALKADVSSVSPSPERLEELWILCGSTCRKWSYAICGNMVIGDIC